MSTEIRPVYEPFKVRYYPRLPYNGKNRQRVIPLIQQPYEPGGEIQCYICLKYLNCLTSHVTRVHGVSCRDYRQRYPGAPLHAPSSLKKRSFTYGLTRGWYTCRYCHGRFKKCSTGKHRQGSTPTFCCAEHYHAWWSQELSRRHKQEYAHGIRGWQLRSRG